MTCANDLDVEFHVHHSFAGANVAEVVFSGNGAAQAAGAFMSGACPVGSQ